MHKDADHEKPVGGEILAHGRDYTHVRVRLEDGQEIQAVIGKPALRKVGCVFGDLVGWNVRVVFRQPPRMARIIELRNPNRRTAATDGDK
jgi:hypothetical protein